MGSLRIIAGTLRGRRISIPVHATYRPTGERTRGALFDILGSEIEGSIFLDAFCGTGAIALEAVSRGARRVIAVDEDPLAVKAVSKLAEAWQVADRCRAICRSLPEGMTRIGADQEPFSIIFADPPYHQGLLGPFLAGVVARGCLAPGGRLIVERDRWDPEDVPPEGLVRTRSARYGGSCLDFYQVAAG